LTYLPSSEELGVPHFIGEENAFKPRKAAFRGGEVGRRARPEGIQGIFLGVMDGIIHALSIITGL